MVTTLDDTTLDSLARIIPSLTHLQREKLLSYGEGMAFANEENRHRISKTDNCGEVTTDSPQPLQAK